jgi:hypothetical protein
MPDIAQASAGLVWTRHAGALVDLSFDKVTIVLRQWSRNCDRIYGKRLPAHCFHIHQAEPWPLAQHYGDLIGGQVDQCG